MMVPCKYTTNIVKCFERTVKGVDELSQEEGVGYGGFGRWCLVCVSIWLKDRHILKVGEKILKINWKNFGDMKIVRTFAIAKGTVNDLNLKREKFEMPL